MGSAQSYLAGLSISEKFESFDVFNHCIGRLNKNVVIVRLKKRNFNECNNQLEGNARENATPLRDNTTGVLNKISTYKPANGDMRTFHNLKIPSTVYFFIWTRFITFSAKK